MTTIKHSPTKFYASIRIFRQKLLNWLMALNFHFMPARKHLCYILTTLLSFTILIAFLRTLMPTFKYLCAVMLAFRILDFVTRYWLLVSTIHKFYFNFIKTRLKYFLAFITLILARMSAWMISFTILKALIVFMTIEIWIIRFYGMT